jgi:hypothetical protein
MDVERKMDGDQNGDLKSQNAMSPRRKPWIAPAMDVIPLESAENSHFTVRSAHDSFVTFS